MNWKFEISSAVSPWEAIETSHCHVFVVQKH